MIRGMKTVLIAMYILCFATGRSSLSFSAPICGCCPSEECGTISRCSQNIDCTCLRMTINGGGLCADTMVSCKNLKTCDQDNKTCSTPNTVCVNNTRCGFPVCYPVEFASFDRCPPIHAQNENSIVVIPNIPINATWKQNSTMVGGGNGFGNTNHQLRCPLGLFVDHDQTVIVADSANHRIIQWKKGDTNGQVIAGGNAQGNRSEQLNNPTDVLIDKNSDSLIIADQLNRRVVRWPLRNGTKQGEILIYSIGCWGLAMDDQRYLYISDTEKHEVRRYQLGDKNGTVIAGGNGYGNGLNQLNFPRYLFVDRQQNVYVSDSNNHRVMKWNKGAREGIVVAGGQNYGNALTQLSNPSGIFVDKLGTLYVADAANHRVMRWSPGDKQGTIIVNGNGAGANQLRNPAGLSLDRHGNLYVVDYGNNRIQRFDIE